ncbi:MAG: TIGR02186 family protein [Paracoccaceae bacterium]
MTWLLALLLLVAAPVSARETVVAGISQNRISITANFDGSEILIFGAVKREAPVPETAKPLDVLIEVTGPSKPVIVRRKERKLGIWVNAISVKVDLAPSYYALASSGPLNEVISETNRQRYKIGLDKAIRLVGEARAGVIPRDFSDALVRLRERDGLYSEVKAKVDISEETLFRTSIKLPSNLVEGDYKARLFILRGKQVIDVRATDIAVRKVGLERFIYSLAHERPLAYGLLSLAVALIAGYGASEAFRLLRR